MNDHTWPMRLGLRRCLTLVIRVEGIEREKPGSGRGALLRRARCASSDVSIAACAFRDMNVTSYRGAITNTGFYHSIVSPFSY